MKPADVLRQVKHGLFVCKKRTLAALKVFKFAAATVVLGPIGERLPFHYREDRYVNGPHGLPWLAQSLAPAGVQEFPRRVFAVWTGDNPLTPARAANLERLRSTLEVDVVLVTPETLCDWLVEGNPLHSAYEYLSLVHRSDYLRGYLMHHHGGGYVDIKRPLEPWTASFDDMEADPDVWVTSFYVTHANWIGKLRGRVGLDILVRHRLLFGKGCFLMRSHTPLTAEWLAEMDRRLDAASVELAAHPGGVYGLPGYPLSWTDLLGRVLDPLTLKYLSHIRRDDRLLLDFTDYR